jgi:hypothetical protein
MLTWKGGQKSMNYSKPEITSLASASFVIHSTGFKDMLGHDSSSHIVETVPAYEADE